MRILAIDQGTTSTRLLELTARGTRILGQRRHQTRYPAPDQVEMDPIEILTHIRDLLADAGAADGIALANQGETCLAWDAATGTPLSPMISWQDRRSLSLLAEMDAPAITARSGLPLDPYFSAGKLAWMRRHLPGVARPGVRLGTSDAWLLDQLTGHFATDRATASRTGLLNMATGTWDAELCAAFDVPIESLPEIRANTAGFGAIGRVPVLAAIVDQQAALYGHGARNPGQGKITFGTGAFALALTHACPDPAHLSGLVPTIAWDLGQGIRYAVDGGVPDAGSAVEWALRAGLAEGVQDFDDFPHPSAIGRGLAFVAAFSGLGAPDWDRSAAPLILGLGPEMGRRDLCQALLEGICFQTAALTRLLTQVTGLAGPVSIDGGISKSRAFAQFLADATGLEIRISAEPECTAFGAALMAAEVLGHSIDRSDDGPLCLPQPQPAQWAKRYDAAQHRAKGWRDI